MTFPALTHYLPAKDLETATVGWTRVDPPVILSVHIMVILPNCAIGPANVDTLPQGFRIGNQFRYSYKRPILSPSNGHDKRCIGAIDAL